MSSLLPLIFDAINRSRKIVVGDQESDVGDWRINKKLLVSSFKSTAEHSPFTLCRQYFSLTPKMALSN